MSDSELLRVGFDMFAQTGYDGLSLRALGERLGISHNLVSARFGSKAEFWKRAVDQRIAIRTPRIESVFDEEFPSEQARLRMLIHRYTELASLDYNLANLVAIETRQETWRLDYILDNYVRGFYAKLENLLLCVALENGTRPMPPASFIVIMVHGIGSYFASIPLLRKLQGTSATESFSVDEHAELFAEILMPRMAPANPVDAHGNSPARPRKRA